MNSEKMKKNGFVFFLLIIVVVAWWFTRSNAREKPVEGTLDVWATWGDDSEALQAFFDGYGQVSEDPVKVTSRVRSDELLEALTGPESPDLVILSGADLVSSYHEQGLITTLARPIAATGIDPTEIYPVLLEQCRTADGEYLCLPWGGDVDALFWNKDLFAAAGLDPEQPPQTMEEMVDYAARLTRCNAEGELTQVGYIPDFPGSQMAHYIRLFGGALDEEPAPELMQNPQPLIDVLAWQQQFYKGCENEELDVFVSSLTPYRSSSHPLYGGRRLNCQQCHRTTSLANKKIPDIGFYEGQVAMMLSGQWQLARTGIDTERPQVKYGVIALPPSERFPERANSSVVQGPVLIIPAGAVDKEVAAGLLAWMMAPEQLAAAAHAHGFLPAGPVAAQESHFRQIPDLKVFLDLLSGPNATTMAEMADTPTLNEALAKLEKAVLHDGAAPLPLVEDFRRRFSPRFEEAIGYDAP